MATDGSIEYALSRVHAHYGRRLAASDWRRLEASQTLGQFLDVLRDSPLADWVSSLDLTQDCHAIERSLRIAWARYVEGVAAWHPREWQPWLAWLTWLPTLSLLAQLARPEPAPAWMMADSVCGPVAPGVLAERIAALKGTALARFEPALSGRTGIGALWRARWQELEPSADAETHRCLETLLGALDAYVQQQAAAENADSTPPREQLIDRLTKLFRAGAGTVVATVCHLGLMGLDLERLRGGLVNRRVFAARG